MIHIFYSRIPNNTGTHLQGQVPANHPMFASIEAAVRTPENYRHVATCTLGDQQDVLEAFQEGEALPRRLGLRPLILGDLMVTDYAVGIVAQGGMRELTGVAVAAYKCRNVPTFSLVAEEPLDQLPPAT